MLPLESSFSSSDGVNIKYRIRRNKGPFIVFVHGLTSNSGSWRNQLEFMEDKGFSTLIFDLRGHGDSGIPRKTEGFSIDRFVKDVIELMDKEGIRKASFIGGCWGAMVIQELYRKYPRRVSSLIIMSGTYKSPYEGYAAPKIYKRIFIPPLKFIYPILAEIARFIGLYMIPYPKFDWDKHKGDSETKVMFLTTWIYTNLFTVLACQKPMMNFNSKSLLKKAKVPILIMSGSKDDLFPRNIQEDMHDFVKHSELKLFDTGHIIINGDYGNQANREILRFLRKNSGKQ